MARIKIGNVRHPIEYLKQLFAPSGYGWGEGSHAAQFNASNVNRTAVFVAAGEDMPTIDSVWLCEFYATSSDGSGDYGHMVATAQGGVAQGCSCVRLKENGVYSAWEWVNPPMITDVEYRTTERYMGQPVYARLVDCGGCPGAESKTIAHNVEGVVDRIVSAHGQLQGYRVFPSSHIGGTMELDIDTNRTEIHLHSTHDYLKDVPCHVLLKYTKM